ncbi:MAG TPA: M56 family metallopeptidase [candidate division Zixibacteria bacterium]|nr:M56 family metallopeptidase [candidate division Zixibacteria bacterium]
MEAIYDYVSDFAYGGFGVLINWLWIGLVVTALVWATMRFSKSFSGSAGYAVWWTQLMVVLALPFLIWILPTVITSYTDNNVPVSVSIEPEGVSQSEEVSVLLHHPQVAQVLPPQLEQNRSDDRAAVSPGYTPRSHKQHRIDVSAVISPHQKTAVDKANFRELLVGMLPQVLLVFWLVVSGWLLYRIIRAHNYMNYLKRTSQPFDWGYLRRFESEFRALCGLRRIEVRLTDKIPHPMAAGLGQPVILLPSRLLDELSEEDLRATILHELTHLRRWDDWSKLGQKVVQALVFFHPAVHWVGRHLDFEREVACDERVVELTGNRSAYAHCLTRLVQLTTGTGTTLMPGALTTRRQIFKRFARLLSGRRSEQPVLKGLRLVMIILLVAVSTVAAIQIAPSVTAPGNAPSYKELARTAQNLIMPVQNEAIRAEVPRVSPVRPVLNDIEPPMPEDLLLIDEELPELIVAGYDDETVAVGHNLMQPVDPDFYWPETEAASVISEVELTVEAPPVPTAPAVSEAAWFADDDNDKDDKVTAAEKESRSSKKDKKDKDKSFSFFSGTVDDEGDVEGGNFKGTSVSRNDDGLLKVRWSDGRNYVKADIDGEIEFTDDDRGIASMSRDAYIEISERSGRSRHAIEIEPERDGTLSYKYRVDDQEQEFDDEGREWLGDVLIELIRRTGIGAEGRVERIMKKDGFDGVINEVERIESDYIQRLYLKILLQQPGLNDDNYATILNLVRTELDSDYDKAELLLSMADRVKDDERLMEFYVDGVATIDSDYDKRRTINGLMLSDDISVELLEKILTIAEDIESDYEKAELLIDMVPHLNALDRSDPVYDRGLQSYINAAIDMDSDYETRRVLSGLSLDRNTDKKVLQEILQIAHRIDSDYEKAELLIDMSELLGDDQDLRHTYIEAIDGVTSDYELRRIISALSDQTDTYSHDDLEYLLELASMMDSDYEKAELFMELSKHCRNDEELLQQLMEGAESIDSDYDKHRVLKDFLPDDCDRQRSMGEQLLSMIEDLESGYEKAEALLEVVHCMAEDSELRELFLDAVGSVDSDYDRQRVLSEFIDEVPMSDDLMISILAVVEDIDSNHDKAQVLSDLADYCRGNGMLEEEFMQVVETMDSDYEMNRLYRRLYGRSAKELDDDDL